MEYSTTFAMPGAFYFESPSRGGAGGINGVNPGVFRPPTTPSASSSIYNIAKSTETVPSSDRTATIPPPTRPGLPHASNSKRKRASREPTPLAEWTLPDSESCFDPGSPMEGSRGELRYTLAGQIDTPAFAAASFGKGNLEESAYSDADYRRALGFGKTQHAELDATSPVNGLYGSSQQQQPSQQSVRSADGWSKFAFSTIGAVAGKVWDFCRTGAFAGFYAGGGKGYSINGSVSNGATPSSSQATRVEEPMWRSDQDAMDGGMSRGMSFGQGKEDGYRLGTTTTSTYTTFPTYGNPNGIVDDDAASRPSAKRRQISATAELGGDDLRRHWIMVSDPEARRQKTRTSTRSRQSDVISSAGHTPGPSSRRPALQSTGSSSRRISVPVSRLSTTPSSLNRRTSVRHTGASALSPREPASVASMRLSPTPSRIPVASPAPPASPIKSSAFSAIQHGGGGSRPSSRSGRTTANSTRLPMPLNGHHHHGNNGSRPATPTLRNHNIVAGRGHARTTSNASNASAAGMRRAPEDVVLHDSPRLDAEAKSLAHRKLAAERDATARVDAFNSRLLDMIRQGREALGSTVEVEMSGDGDGDGGGGEGGWVSDN